MSDPVTAVSQENREYCVDREDHHSPRGSWLPAYQGMRGQTLLVAVACLLAASFLAYTARAHRDRDLIAAVRSGDTSAMQTLLVRGADPYPALAASARSGRVDRMRLLLYASNVTLQKERAGRLLCAAAEGGNREAVLLLLNAGAPVEYRATAPEAEAGMTPLLYAIRSGRVEAASILIEHGANPQTQDDWGRDAMALAVQSGSTDLERFLVQQGADVPL